MRPLQSLDDVLGHRRICHGILRVDRIASEVLCEVYTHISSSCSVKLLQGQAEPQA
jgi:hypothetical protein